MGPHKLRPATLTSVMVRPHKANVGIPDDQISLEAETITLLAAMSSQPNDARKAVINTLIRNLKDNGIWTKLDCLWVMAAHDSQAATLNWKNPASNTLTVGGGSPTHSTDLHFAYNGSSDWHDTNFNASTAGGNYTQNAASAFIWERQDTQKSTAQFGWFDGTDGVTLLSRNASNQYSVRLNQAAGDAAAGATNATGLFTGNRTASNAIQTYRNGASVDTGTNASTALNNKTFQIGSAASGVFAACQIACAGVGGSLDETENSNLYTAINTYMIAVGAA